EFIQANNFVYKRKGRLVMEYNSMVQIKQKFNNVEQRLISKGVERAKQKYQEHLDFCEEKFRVQQAEREERRKAERRSAERIRQGQIEAERQDRVAHAARQRQEELQLREQKEHE